MEMTVIFFKQDFAFAKEYVEHNNNCVAFWYSDGLSSYTSLSNVIKISNILIESTIIDCFKKQYSSLLQNISFESFNCTNNSISLEPKNEKKIGFFASNDTHVYLFKNIIKICGQDNTNFFCKEGENALSTAQKFGFNPSLEKITNSIENLNILVLGNDWGLEERDISNTFLINGINTVCIQESILDLNPIDGRMRNCSFPIFQGLNSLDNFNLNKVVCAVIGNPRFEYLEPTPLPKTKRVFINVNFTYGIFEEIREKWINDILTCCNDINIDYVISQHPRDNGKLENLKVLKSNPGIVHQSIKDSTVVISRFSALLLEAIALGRPAIYYNPHKEQMFYKLEPDNKSLFYAENYESLCQILKLLMSDSYSFSGNELLNSHLGDTRMGKASFYISELLKDLVVFPQALKKISFMENATIKAKKIKLFFIDFIRTNF